MSKLEEALAQRELERATRQLAAAHRVREGLLGAPLTEDEQYVLTGVLDTQIARAHVGVARVEFRIAQARYDRARAAVKALKENTNGGSEQ